MRLFCSFSNNKSGKTRCRYDFTSIFHAMLFTTSHSKLSLKYKHKNLPMRIDTTLLSNAYNTWAQRLKSFWFLEHFPINLAKSLTWISNKHHDGDLSERLNWRGCKFNSFHSTEFQSAVECWFPCFYYFCIWGELELNEPCSSQR